MEAIFRLAWLREASGLVPVNWRDLETEELGSVYESLLELTPLLVDDGRGFAFAEAGEAKGHARKTTGSYYTPDSLVQALLDSALNPVLDRIEAEAVDRPAALLSMTVLDPACGSGHFLLAAARRIATRLARARAAGVASPADFRRALRDVARACIYGVDRNPMAVELTKVALWIETVEPGKPLGFLDANIRCGDALLGVFDLKVLEQGIPDVAYKPLAGDDKDAAKVSGRINREQRESAAQQDLAITQRADFARTARAVTAMLEDDLAGVQARARAYEAVHAEHGWWATKTACDLYVAAFLASKHFRSGALTRAKTPDRIPTTLDVRTALAGRQSDAQLVTKAIELAGSARAFHWPLEFPAIMAAGGFDVVLGNPPWDVMQLGEEEYFAQRLPEIAELAGAARKRAIAALEQESPTTFATYKADKRRFEAANEFARASGRFDLTARGKLNTYALFAELFASLTSKHGRAGVIVPTGIATDATTSPFFAHLVTGRRLAAVLSFENEEMIFPSIHHAMKFCLMILRSEDDTKPIDFVFFARQIAALSDRDRRFTLSSEDIARINPNTKTAPVFRSSADAELAAKIYASVPVLIDETKGKDGNPWGVEFRQGLFNMTSDSGLFRTAAQLGEAGFVREGSEWFLRSAVAGKGGGQRPANGGLPTGMGVGKRFVPLYEAKMIDYYDHRAAGYAQRGDERGYRVLPATTVQEHSDPSFEITPFYWVDQALVEDRVLAIGWRNRWLLGFKDITSATNERTFIPAVVPNWGVGNNMPLIFLNSVKDARQIACFIANISALVFDLAARQKAGGVHMNFFYVKQFPVLLPAAYAAADLTFITSRLLELTYTSHAMTPFARDLGWDGPPFAWDEDRRAQLRAELDAFYTRAYGLTRDELRYILDPADVKGPDYPSETFRVLKKNEIARFGEYRTARLVLAAYDQLAKHSLAAE
jgi:hypothetical protein